MAFTSDKGIILDINKAWVTSFGIEREQALGKTAAELGLWANLAERQTCMDILTRDGSVQDCEALLVTRTGPRPHLMSGHRVESPAERHLLWEFRDITESKCTLAQVGKLSMVVEQSPVGVVITDLSGRIEFVNDAFVRISGYSRDEAIGQNPRILNSGLTPADTYPALWNTLTQGRVWEGEFVNRRKDGRIFHEHTIISPIRQAGGLVTHYAAAKQDVTDRLLTQQRLTNSENQFHGLFDSMSSGAAIYRATDDGADFLIQDFNRAALVMERVSRHQVIGKRLSEVFPGVKEFGLLEVLQRVFKTGQSEHFPLTFYHDDRIHGWRENYVYRLPTGEVVAVYDDVTARKQAELALRESHQKLFSLLNSMAEGAYGVDADGRFSFVNQAFLRILGYTNADELLGKTVHELIHHSYADGSPYPAHECAMNVAFHQQQAAHNPQDTFWRQNGTPVAVESWSQPILIDGVATGSVATFLDITERNLAQHNLQNIARQLRLDQERFRDFSTSASDWFWETDARHRFCFFSDNFEKVYGLPLNHLLGKSRQGILEVDTLNEPRVVDAHLAQLVAHEPFKNFEYRIRVADGSIHWVSVSGIPHFDADGQFTGYRGTGSIVTERKNAEINLRNVKERLEAAATAGIVGIWDWDIPNNQLIWDSVMYQLYGIRAQDWGGAYEAWASAIHPGDKTHTEGEIQAALCGEREFAPEFRIIWPDGSIHYIKAASHTSFDDLGKPLRMIGVNYDLTEQKKIEQALQRESNKSLSLLRHASDGIHILDTDGHLVDASDSFFVMLGYSREELIGKNISLWTTEFNSADHRQLSRQLFLKTSGDQWETKHRRKDGEIIDVEVRGTTLLFGDKQVMLNSSRDISERKKANAERDRLLKIIEEAPDFIAMSDMQSHLKYLNVSGARLVGLPEDVDLTPLEIKDMHPQWSAKLVLEEGVPTVLRQGFWQGETALLHRNGHETPVSQLLLLHRDELGNPEYLSTIMRDMTDFKKVQHLLEEKMRLLGTILDNSSVGITFVQNRRLIWSNQRMGDIFGYTQAEMSNQSTRMFFPSQESYEELGCLGYDTLARGESYISEREMRHKDGTIVWTRLSGKSVDNADLDLGSIWVFEDIAQQKQTQMQLEAAKESAEAANLSKSRFLATMSHEIRTPMNGILGMAQMLLMPDLKEDRRGDYARTILASGQSLLILLNDILDLSKIEAGKFQLESIAFAPETMMHETTNLFAGAVQAKGLHLDCQWHGASGQRYLADSHRLRQMLSNLVGNAIKFTRAGQVRIEASEIECTENTCVLEFAVSDTGIGIPADKLDLLFKPFSQADSSTTREFGGTGLGLSIVRSLAKAMQGDVGVSSQPGQGSRFWFRVQVQRITESQESRKSERMARANNPADSELSTTSLCGYVLVAEDNPVNCMVIESLLNSLGITVSVVHDGQQSVEFIERAFSDAKGDQPKRPDLILMDLHMPVMDGYGATQQVRQWENANQRPRLPIIALTADAFEEDRQRCLAIGMDDFLSKPIALEALKSALAKWLPAGVAAKSPVSLNPVDMEAFTALVAELTPLLQDNKFTAISRFKSLQNLVKDTQLADEIEPLESMLQELRFDQVLARLRLICLNRAAIDN